MQTGKMLVLMVFTAAMIGAYARTDAPADAEVYFISPAEGAALQNPISVRFGLRNVGVAPAGVEFPKTGHHHLLIDVADLPNPDLPVPANEQHRHFGGGQTEVQIELEPGQTQPATNSRRSYAHSAQPTDRVGEDNHHRFGT